MPLGHEVQCDTKASDAPNLRDQSMKIRFKSALASLSTQEYFASG